MTQGMRLRAIVERGADAGVETRGGGTRGRRRGHGVEDEGVDALGDVDARDDAAAKRLVLGAVRGEGGAQGELVDGRAERENVRFREVHIHVRVQLCK